LIVARSAHTVVKPLLLALAFASGANAQTFKLFGYVEGRETYVKAPPS